MEHTSTKEGEVLSPLLLTIIVGMHLVGAAGAIYFFSASGLAALFVAHLFFATFGVSLGYHRLLSHKCFEGNRGVELFLALCATLCFQGGPIYWASVHRAHHIKTEKSGDAHSAARGFWWCHMGWLFYLRPNGFSFAANKRYVADLLVRPELVWIDRNQLAVNGAFLAVLLITCALFGRTDLFIWVGPVRIVTVWHATWLINSFYHGASFRQGQPIRLRNHVLADLILGGEGWHRAHHERPNVLRHEGRFHVDTGYLFLRILSLVGVVRLPRRSRSMDRKTA